MLMIGNHSMNLLTLTNDTCNQSMRYYMINDFWDYSSNRFDTMIGKLHLNNLSSFGEFKLHVNDL